MNKEQFSKYINNYDFSEMFRNLGWDNFTADHKIEIQGNIYQITGISHKRNFPILQCIVPQGKMPDINIRKQLWKKLSKLYFEHLLLIADENKTWQYWQLPLYEDSKAKKLVSFSWNEGQDVEPLFQKLRNIVFELNEEEILTLADVIERVNTLTANNEKVTKKFYAEFIKQHSAFLGFIIGIDDALPDNENEKKQWYASLMLNRLMFCYFIQKKGFLDWNVNYLREKLVECKKHKSKTNFYGFYRSFLLELFHDELGRPEDKRTKTVSPVPFGNIPYLNGGLFDVHELESTFTKISIKDEAFEKIFAFFDEWNWHLDTRITASGKDINPDVIGYIFEKYINQKEMGAYYTKEDITDYIGKNTIIPFLLDKVKSYYSAPFNPGGGFWQYLQDSSNKFGDEYIYDSVKKGGEGLASINDVEIPENIRIGIDTTKPNLLERRKDWNTATPEKIGLPTEIWRETIARLQRYFELKTKIKKGHIQEINDLITYNLNIRKLIQDYLEQTQDAKFIRNFYKALCEITILDPTCGSGAFLFAALNILQPLYEVCLQRMEEFYKAKPKSNTDFEQRLEPVLSGKHPNITYYIFKTIILHNLYGVDLMKEAVEIAKLRLFLKLVAEVDPSRRKKNYGLEPLPDIDFNIRSGNTLVGFATEQQLEEVVRNSEGDLIYKEKLEELKSACKFAAKEYEHFQMVQTTANINDTKYKEHKKSLTKTLKDLSEKLNLYLADTYGLGTQTQWKSAKEKKEAYQQWKDSHQPFHWLAEFYEIISKGGFDVVIGNPPYVEYSQIDYEIKGLKSVSSGAIHAMCIERSYQLLSKNGNISMIVPLALVCTQRMIVIQKIIEERKAVWYANFAWRPGKLFDTVNRALSIFISNNSNKPNCNNTGYIKWNSETRDDIFKLLHFTSYNKSRDSFWSPKLSTTCEIDILEKLTNKPCTIQNYIKISKYNLYYRTTGGLYWKIFTDKPPSFTINGNKGSSSRETSISLDKKDTPKQFAAIFSSSLFWWWYTITSNLRDLNPSDLYGFKFTDNLIGSDELINIAEILLKDMYKNSTMLTRIQEKTGETKTQSFKLAKSKPIIDEIDKVLAKHYGFTDEELDFIINYDIKYRMGTELEGER